MVRFDARDPAGPVEAWAADGRLAALPVDPRLLGDGSGFGSAAGPLLVLSAHADDETLGRAGSSRSPCAPGGPSPSWS